jgi:hypothetical protein
MQSETTICNVTLSFESCRKMLSTWQSSHGYPLIRLPYHVFADHNANNYLGEFFRRITRKLGKPQAITATAHKLARIVFHLLKTKEAYNESVFRKCEEETLRRAELRLRKQAAMLGFQIVPAANQ